MNRPVRDPYAGWCERRTSSEKSGEAVYSIVCPCFLFVRALGKTHLLTSFGWRGWFERLGNVCGFEGLAYYLILFFISSVRLVVNGNADALTVE